jgi:hypothetical protein
MLSGLCVGGLPFGKVGMVPCRKALPNDESIATQQAPLRITKAGKIISGFAKKTGV